MSGGKKDLRGGSDSGSKAYLQTCGSNTCGQLIELQHWQQRNALMPVRQKYSGQPAASFSAHRQYTCKNKQKIRYQRKKKSCLLLLAHMEVAQIWWRREGAVEACCRAEGQGRRAEGPVARGAELGVGDLKERAACGSEGCPNCSNVYSPHRRESFALRRPGEAAWHTRVCRRGGRTSVRNPANGKLMPMLLRCVMVSVPAGSASQIPMKARGLRTDGTQGSEREERRG
ncbi:hypothetical protein EYF80_009528 [Liparis tanakae]|uniref:Uncharacterized protein n=1 Tax=Liparis tanakae TaxID=230148 RepID=A0A4Z2ISP1_9TELE|nr:hypothetical protein EYF80_009528 [Liparis tanakae]